ncbi:MAG: LamG-like jellyroll fold domain-containing protein [Chthoniobacteraceae bacterium]
MDADRLSRLLDQYVDEALESAEKAELEQMLLSSAEARAVFWERTRLHTLLRKQGEQAWGRQAAGPASRKVVRFPISRIARLAAAACLLIGGLALSWSWWTAPREVMTDGVAVLGPTVNAEWSDCVDRAAGTVLPPGWLRLQSGLAQVEFVSGARVILEGPAEFRLVAPLEGFCQSGRLTAEVPGQAIGFRVGAPKVAVVDLGTEFGMEVHRDGGTEVHVFRGQVELQRGGDVLALATGDSARVTAEGAWAQFDEAAPMFPTSEQLENRAAISWRQQQDGWLSAMRQVATMPGLVWLFDFEGSTDWARTLPNVSENPARGPDGSIVGCRWQEGRWPGKRALEFRAVTDRVRLGVPGEFPSLTLAAWVRVDALDLSYNSLVMADGWDAGDVHWQITKSGQIVLGVHGAAKQYNYTTGPLFPPERLGKWTHLAVVFDRAQRRVAHYLDGQRVGDEALRPETDLPVRLEHAELGNWNSNARGDSRPIRNLRGRMDEVLVFNRGLSAAEITHIFRAGQRQP